MLFVMEFLEAFSRLARHWTGEETMLRWIQSLEQKRPSRNGNSLPPLAARLVEELQRVKVLVHFLRGSEIKEGSHHHTSSI
jgi:hypothetical protein